MKIIEVNLKEPKLMRYPSAGDYYERRGKTVFDIADTGSWITNRLVLIHELVEQTLTEYNGISEQSIMDFDLMFEKEREQGLHGATDEPGHDPRAPYRREHILAENIERLICSFLDYDWDTHDKTVNDLKFD